MPSIKDVAAEARVSLSTVSKVLNGRNDVDIPAATRERVRAAARRVEYHPNAIARGLAGKRMDTIGVVMAYSEASVTSDPYLGPCLDGILYVCKQRQQKALLYLEGDWNDALSRVPVFCDGHCDGLLIVIPRTGNGIVDALAQRTQRVPFVLVGDSREGDDWGAADVDNVQGAQRITDYLIAQGHRRIAVFCGNYDFYSNKQRIEGYQRSLEAAGIVFDASLLFAGEYHAEWGAQNVRRLLERFPARDAARPTAIFALCDVIAVGALEELKAQGVPAPQEMSVVGFDDIPVAPSLGLTTMRHPMRQVGERAVDALLRGVRETIAAGHRELVPAEIIVRSSVANIVGKGNA